MFELIVMRHGLTDWNLPGRKRVMGRRPIPLNITGRARVQAAARSLRDVALRAVYASPTVRTMQTAKIVCRGRAGIPLLQSEGLAEIDYGHWLDRPFEEIYATPAWTEYWEHGSRAQVPGGERIVDVQARIVAVASEARQAFPDGPVLFVSHADVIKTLLAYALRLDLDQWQGMKCDPASLSVIHFESDRPRLARMNCGRY